MKNLRNIIKDLIKNSNKNKKRSAIFIGNTKKSSRFKFYNSQIHTYNKWMFISIIFYREEDVRIFTKMVDGKIDVIFVDTEKKILSNKKKVLFNIERIVRENIKKSNIFPYKANDATVQCAEQFLFYKFINNKRGIGDQNILIIGAGNIGSKLALKLTESGANVFVERRNKLKLAKIVKAINIIKPDATKAKTNIVYNFKKIFPHIDIVINCSNNTAVLKIDRFNFFKKKILYLDIGKGMFDEKLLKEVNNEDFIIYRLDLYPGYISLLSNWEETCKHFSKQKFGKRKIGNKMYISRGILGNKGDLVVDSPNKPKKIYGICDGYGDFLK